MEDLALPPLRYSCVESRVGRRQSAALVAASMVRRNSVELDFQTKCPLSARRNIGISACGWGIGRCRGGRSKHIWQIFRQVVSIAASSRHPTPADRQNNGIHKVRLCFYAAGRCCDGLWDVWEGEGLEGWDGWRWGGTDDGVRPLATRISSTLDTLPPLLRRVPLANLGLLQQEYLAHARLM